MTLPNLALVTALWAALAAGVSPLLAQADDAAPLPMAAASAATPGAPTALLRTPEEKRDNATAPDLRPEQAAVPQLSIPIGRKATANRPPEGPAVRGSAAASAGSMGGIHDGAARCEAQVSTMERAACRARLAHETRPR